MYSIINEKAEKILEEFSIKSGGIKKYVEHYVFTRDLKLKKLTREKYEKNFIHFYALNAAHLDKSFLKNFFEKLFDEKYQKMGAKEVLEEILNEWEKDGFNSVQFSFATKLVHSINGKTPIYDSKIASFYILPNFHNLSNKDSKIALCKNIYDFLEDEYAKIKREKKLDNAITLFKDKLIKENFNQIDSISDEKIIDYYIWQFTKMLQDPKSSFYKEIRRV